MSADDVVLLASGVFCGYLIGVVMMFVLLVRDHHCERERELVAGAAWLWPLVLVAIAVAFPLHLLVWGYLKMSNAALRRLR